jgi:hypothetical protein
MTKVVRKITKTSEYSYFVNIPKDIIDRYGWQAKQKVTVEDKGKGVIEIRDWQSK